MRFGWLLALIGVLTFLLGFNLAWLFYPWLADNDATVYLIGLAALLLLGAGYGLNFFLQGYVSGVKHLTDQIKMILRANPAYRIRPDGPADMRRLAHTVNTLADRLQEALQTQTEQIQQAKASLEEEKNRLAALMSELTEGVLVCNLEGQILLYNNRAKQLLSQKPGGLWGDRIGGFVGLGRSVFGLIDRNTITQALEDLAYRHEKQSQQLFSQFVATATNGQLIRTRIAPILTPQQEFNGFVLTVEDVTRQTQSSRRRDMLLQALTEGVRSSLANIRTAIETIEQFPQMDTTKLGQLRRVIYDESLTLSARLNQITSDYDTDLKADWQLEEMLGSDLLWAIQRRFEDKLEVSTVIAEHEENLWLKVDSYSVVQVITEVMRQLKINFGITEVRLSLKKIGQLAAFDLIWEDGKVDMDTLWSWQNQPLQAEGEAATLTLREVAERHGGEVWSQTDRTTNLAYFRLLLPTTQPKPIRNVHIVQGSRPEYYDFDLFHQPGQNPELDHRPLAELTYTVFDTETTGLNPSEGDEIISISAVRVVNGRLLRQEIFDQLVDPQRSLSLTSIEIHGISREMLEGQPIIEQVLPLFARFTEGTVLVGHNAAFDMRLLQMKETKTGIKFTNPVLDTLLLSAVVHPNHKDHSLESVAQRLGINIIGRHTSLGDAILTGEIFLKLIPLLAERGITTLQHARNAAQKTYFARLSY